MPFSIAFLAIKYFTKIIYVIEIEYKNKMKDLKSMIIDNFKIMCVVESLALLITVVSNIKIGLIECFLCSDFCSVLFPFSGSYVDCRRNRTIHYLDMRIYSLFTWIDDFFERVTLAL